MKQDHDAIYVFDKTQAQGVIFEFCRALNGCVICFNLIMAECLRKIIRVQQKQHQQSRGCDPTSKKKTLREKARISRIADRQRYHAGADVEMREDIQGTIVCHCGEMQKHLATEQQVGATASFQEGMEQFRRCVVCFQGRSESTRLVRCPAAVLSSASLDQSGFQSARELDDVSEVHARR